MGRHHLALLHTTSQADGEAWTANLKFGGVEQAFGVGGVLLQDQEEALRVIAWRGYHLEHVHVTVGLKHHLFRVFHMPAERLLHGLERTHTLRFGRKRTRLCRPQTLPAQSSRTARA